MTIDFIAKIIPVDLFQYKLSNISKHRNNESFDKTNGRYLRNGMSDISNLVGDILFCKRRIRKLLTNSNFDNDHTRLIQIQDLLQLKPYCVQFRNSDDSK